MIGPDGHDHTREWARASKWFNLRFSGRLSLVGDDWPADASSVHAQDRHRPDPVRSRHWPHHGPAQGLQRRHDQPAVAGRLMAARRPRRRSDQRHRRRAVAIGAHRLQRTRRSRDGLAAGRVVDAAGSGSPRSSRWPACCCSRWRSRRSAPSVRSSSTSSCWPQWCWFHWAPDELAARPRANPRRRTSARRSSCRQ